MVASGQVAERHAGIVRTTESGGRLLLPTPSQQLLYSLFSANLDGSYRLSQDTVESDRGSSRNAVILNKSFFYIKIVCVLY